MKRLKTIVILGFLVFNYQILISQSVAINTDGSTADPTSILDVKSTTAGVLLPRMTVGERNAIASIALGLIIFQTDDTPGFRYFDGSGWKLLVPAVAIIKDEKTSGMNGGPAVNTLDNWFVRDLSTLEGDVSFVPGGVVSNQFTLNPGIYIIEGSASANSVDAHQIRLMSTDATVKIVGSGGFSSVASNLTPSFISGVITITAQKTFEVQHWVQTTNNNTEALGVSSSSAAEDVVYTILKITKIE